MRKHYTNYWSLPLAQWPTQDRGLWEVALEPVDIFDSTKKISASWSPATRESMRYRYGRWLAWLQRQGLLDPEQSPGDRVTPDLLRRFIADDKTSPVTLFMQVAGHKRVLDAIASSHDWTWIQVICRQLKRAAIPVRDKHTRIVEPSALYALGLRLIETANTGRLVLDAMRARDGLIISLLAARPIRRGNLVSIEVGRHLLWTGDTYWLAFDKSETKNHRPIEAECPAELVPHIQRYLEFHRPVLLARAIPALDTARLWIGSNGGILGAAAIQRQIVVHTKAAFGWPINPHLFRDCAATAVAVHDPEHVRIASVILGHRRQSTTEKYYNQARMLTAAREHHRTILDLRRRGRRRRVEDR